MKEHHTGAVGGLDKKNGCALVVHAVAGKIGKMAELTSGLILAIAFISNATIRDTRYQLDDR